MVQNIEDDLKFHCVPNLLCKKNEIISKKWFNLYYDNVEFFILRKTGCKQYISVLTVKHFYSVTVIISTFFKYLCQYFPFSKLLLTLRYIPKRNI